MSGKKRNYESNQNFPNNPNSHNTLQAEKRTRNPEFYRTATPPESRVLTFIFGLDNLTP